jgi:acetoin utilization deacetylase AcuC-like enzyme
MNLYYADHFVLPLPEGHRFPMAKYQLLRQRVIETKLVEPDKMIIPPPATKAELRLVHQADYLEKVFNGSLTEREMRRIGFPWSAQMVERARRSVGGTISACRSALKDGIAANLAGGTHHAYPDHGEGYCVFNDVAVAARVLQREGKVQKVVIIDCDVHQGNGSAAIFQGDDSVFTFSIHGAKNFPFHKESSDLDIALADGTSDEAYLEALEPGLEEAIERSEAELAIYVSGADPYVGDRLGKLALSKAGLAQRDRMVLEVCHQAGIPAAITMGGGYARIVEDTVDIHFQTLQIAEEYNRNDHLQ